MADQEIINLLAAGRIRVDQTAGLVYAPRSNTPNKPCGALTAKGYLRVCLNVDGKQRHFLAHRIVWVSANGPVPPGYTIDHVNTIKTDNRLENLEAVTGPENTRRAKVNGAYVHVGRRDGIRDERGRFGKKAAGWRLDGETWNQFPQEPTGVTV